MPDMVFSPTRAARAADVSATSIRNYLANPVLAPLFSEDARNIPRTFSEHDVRLLRFIKEQTANRKSYADIAALVEQGALQQFDWQPPQRVRQEEQPPAQEEQRAEQVALVVSQQFQQIAAGLTAALSEARLNAERLQQALAESERERGKLQERLDALQHERRPWYKRLFGG